MVHGPESLSGDLAANNHPWLAAAAAHPLLTLGAVAGAAYFGPRVVGRIGDEIGNARRKFTNGLLGI